MSKQNSKQQQTPLQILDNIIEDTAESITDFKKSPQDFTRNRKLTPYKLIKTTINMQGNSLNAELLNAFPDIDDRVTASAYEQAKEKLNTDIFYHILHNYNNQYAIDFKMACMIMRKYFALYSTYNSYKIFAEIVSYINPVRPRRRDNRNLVPKAPVWFMYRVA